MHLGLRPLGSFVRFWHRLLSRTSRGAWGTDLKSGFSNGLSGPFQVHFYYNSTTGVANYTIVYKVVFNVGVGG